MASESRDIVAVRDWADTVVAQVEQVFFGKRPVVVKLLAALLARGHALLEDVPGTGKTIAARALAATLGASFKRVQCTPDLLPADVLGVAIWSPEKQSFAFRRGPVFANLVLVDEINRATPRTQSALLEAMAERQVSIDGRIMPLPDPFFIMATENPVEFEGTFPLPEAQKDRFLLSVDVGYPPREAEALMLESQRRLTHPVEDLKALTDPASILAHQAAVVGVHVDDAVRDYILDLTRASREEPAVRVGVSPRGALALYKAAQARAAIAGRGYVVPEDVKELAPDVFRKRLILTAEAALKGTQPERVIASLLDRVAVPAFKEKA
jgi:MoxR-like ATPase